MAYMDCHRMVVFVQMVVLRRMALAIKEEQMNEKQRRALKSCCRRFNVDFNEENYHPGLGTPDGWFEGWIGKSIYVGCSPEGGIHS